MLQSLDKGWRVLQDVHDLGEELGLFREDFYTNSVPMQFSEWEPIDRLCHLQLLFAQHPYYGRELRSFNSAPWWYRCDFTAPADPGRRARICFDNVDYYCRAWLNGTFLGEHEGYCVPFSFEAGGALRAGAQNTLIVKVWSPNEQDADGGKYERRTFGVVRHMVKGTYEHDDTFIQRDVNPVGIYGGVRLECGGGPRFAEAPDVRYSLDPTRRAASLTVSGVLEADGPCEAELLCRDALTGRTALCVRQTLRPGDFSIGGDAQPVALWSTWDRDGARLYTVSLRVRGGGGEAAVCRRVGFRTAELRRTPDKTEFFLNGRRLYIRGTSYFPDVYVSAMNRERYLRDLLAIRAAGFNLVRVHVHVEQDVFYDLCSELGIAVMQDSEYNWTAPADKAFEERFVRIFRETVRRIGFQPSVVCWICLNEPGFNDPLGSNCRMMAVSPGPALYAAALECAPNAAIIKGSFCADDLTSGDSHNYAGSINAEDTHYTDIDGTSEKLNTEYGFDAPPCADSLRREPALYKRLSGVLGRIPELQEYQYALLKYYTEHYRLQKNAPNGGYVQFLFGDVCPQSFYGLYDYWGIPKRGLDAMLESNMPVGIFVRHKGSLGALCAVNDYDRGLGACRARWTVTGAGGETLLEGEKTIDLPADSRVEILDFAGWTCSGPADVALTLEQSDGLLLAHNLYRDIFRYPKHPAGHPAAMSHELGMRLYEPRGRQ